MILLLLALIQIIVESLPISSSGHIRLFQKIFQKIGYSIEPIPHHIEYLMHIPTIFVLLVFLAKRYGPLLFDFPRSSVSLVHILSCIILADIITVGFYLLFSHIGISDTLLPYGFLITALALLSLHYAPYGHNAITYKAALYIGMAQGCALIPGISRLGVTTVTAIWLGIAPSEAVYFSCAIELPLICTAVLKSFYETGSFSSLGSLPYNFIALIVPTMYVAYLLLVQVVSWAASWQLASIGWYMLIVALISFIFL